MGKSSTTYKQAGVDIDAANEWLDGLREKNHETHPGVLSGIGGFASLYELPEGYQQPVLVSGTDGVGTKLKLGIQYQQHHGIGIDLVAMCVNDVITTGAKPLYFLDYLAMGKFDQDVASALLDGISDACKRCNMSLVGGETAEMPGCYAKDHYDLAGFCVGIVEKKAIIDGRSCQAGDKIIALPATGPHANGFSLIRQLLDDHHIDPQMEQLANQPLLQQLLCPTQLYASAINQLKAAFDIHAMAHITGGGIIDNLPRVIPSHLTAQINDSLWPSLPIFDWLQSLSGMDHNQMHRTFNMGVGMLVIVPEHNAQSAIRHLHKNNEKAYIVGELINKTQSMSNIVFVS